ncbi:protein EXORDIUM-like 3 [Impatiens glandulifera]|uniref:protein EXORDIUM-like 3 n=1 Tax=Impatiens glandulifera TaxID=253017 RepID=UPI001FB056A6|nr:protein EXORDIUM-like 3 [Impatiens glandulifera]
MAVRCSRRQPALLITALAVIISVISLFIPAAAAWMPWANPKPNATADLLLAGVKKNEGSSEFIDLTYHMGPVLTANINVHIIWYGTWKSSQKHIIRDFINSISAVNSTKPSVSDWWRTVQMYTDQTGANISSTVTLGKEKNDRFYSYGKSLTRLSIQSVIKSAVTAKTQPLPINPKNGVYLLLTSDDVFVQDFCKGACGFHYFTFPSIVGFTLPYAWIGNSIKQCPGQCAYPFSVPDFIPGLKAAKSPNGDIGVDGMVNVIGHELAEVSTNPLINAWYAGQDPIAPVEIADLCVGIYGTGGGGSYMGQMLKSPDGSTYNINGVKRRFLIQWLWNYVLKYCTGPNALD